MRAAKKQDRIRAALVKKGVPRERAEELVSWSYGKANPGQKPLTAKKKGK